MAGALVVSGSERASELIRSLLETAGMTEVRAAASKEAARAQFALKDAELIVLLAPISDANPDALAAEAVRGTQAGVILVVSDAEEGRQTEEAGGILVQKPVSQAAFLQAVRHARASYRRTVQLTREYDRLNVRLDEMKLVSRAKLLLMSRFSMTEEQAHHYLEKRAMQERISLGEAAKSVVANCAI